MIKAVLFDFDETLQDRTSAFDKYTDAFTAEFMPNLSGEEKQKRRDDMVRTGNGGYAERNTWFSGLIKMWDWKIRRVPRHSQIIMRKISANIALFLMMRFRF